MSDLYLYHSTTFDLVEDEAEKSKDGKVTYQGSEYDSLGTRTVNSAYGEEERHKVALDTPEGSTYVKIPDDYDASPTALTHLSEMLLDRHAPGDAITGIYSPDDAKLAGRIAALLGVEHLKTKPKGA